MTDNDKQMLVQVALHAAGCLFTSLLFAIVAAILLAGILWTDWR